jgi:transposase
MAAAALWRCSAAVVFSPVAIAPGSGAAIALSTTPGAIEIEFASGARMRITGPVEASTVRVMVAVLAKSKRR